MTAAPDEPARQRARWGQQRGLRSDAYLPLPDQILLCWLPMRFACGHALDVGVDTVRHQSDFEEKLTRFLDSSSAFPCPRCGSSTGRPAEQPVTAAATYLVAHDLWYRACPDSQQADATRNAARARSNRGQKG